MSVEIEYLSNRASDAVITEHLECCDAYFVPRLSDRVEIRDYAKKLVNRAARLEAWSDHNLIGLVAVYCNDQEKRIAYITSVSVLPSSTGKGIAARLIGRCVDHAKAAGMRQASLEVVTENMPAIRLYEKCGFVAGAVANGFVSMHLDLTGGNEHEQQA